MVIFVILYVQNCIQEHTKTIISGKEMVCNRISYREWFVLPEIYNCILNSSWCFLEHNILFSDIKKTIYALNLISNFYHDNVQTRLLPSHFEALTNEQIKHRNVWIFMAKIYTVLTSYYDFWPDLGTSSNVKFTLYRSWSSFYIRWLIVV
jgi:hypothetical protein